MKAFVPYLFGPGKRERHGPEMGHTGGAGKVRGRR